MDTALAAVDIAAIVFTVRRTFARRHVLAEGRRHLMETLRGRAFQPGPDGYIAGKALAPHSRRLTVPRPDRRTPAPAQLTFTADFAWHRWWIAGTDGKPPRESSGYERARVASLAVRNAIRDARTAPAPRGTEPTPPRLGPPRTPTTTRLRPRRTRSTTQAGMPLSLRRSRQPPRERGIVAAGCSPPWPGHGPDLGVAQQDAAPCQALPDTAEAAAGGRASARLLRGSDYSSTDQHKMAGEDDHIAPDQCCGDRGTS